MIHKVRMVALAAVVSLMVGSHARGQDPATDAQNKLLARRAAEADCYRKLAETVYGLELKSATYVRDFVTESDEIKTNVDTFVRGIKLGPPRYYDDGVCEVDAEVKVAKVITHLKKVHAEHYKGRHVTTTDIEHITERIKTDIIHATGSGAPRPDLPPDLPIGVEDVITQLPPAYVPPALSVPAIWKTVPPAARLMAAQAARRDAQRKLLERIKGLRLNSDTLVRDFITEYDEISTRAEGMVVGSYEVHKYYHNDELIVEVTMAVPVEKLVRTIKELHSEHYRGRSVTTTDVTKIQERIHRSVIEATGSGVPPSRYLKQAIQQAGVHMPDWASRSFSATGEGTDARMDTAQGKLKAARAATLDAMRKLAEQIQGVQIDSTTTVRDFTVEYDEIAAQVNTMLAGAITRTATYADDIARVTVTVSGADVWSVINHQISINNRRG